MTRHFPIEVILSVSHGKLLCEMNKVYDICNFLTGDNLFTHQLIRAHEFCKPWILEQHPQLKDWNGEEITTRNYKQYIAKARKKFGKELPLTPLPPDRWTHINAIEEAKAMMGDDRVIVVEPDDN